MCSASQAPSGSFALAVYSSVDIAQTYHTDVICLFWQETGSDFTAAYVRAKVFALHSATRHGGVSENKRARLPGQIAFVPAIVINYQNEAAQQKQVFLPHVLSILPSIFIYCNMQQNAVPLTDTSDP